MKIINFIRARFRKYINDEKWLIQNGITTEMKDKMNADLASKNGYVI